MLVHSERNSSLLKTVVKTLMAGAFEARILSWMTAQFIVFDFLNVAIPETP